jgi:hypothetical protein
LADHQKCDNLPTIQILIFTIYTLRQYYKKVKPKSEIGINIFDILELGFNFRHRCPLCGAADCAQFIGYYFRPIIDEKGRFYKDFPVPRFLCRGKGEAKMVNHRTFSLLHYHLIPYYKCSIPFLIKIMKSRHIDQMTLQVLRDYIIEFTATGPVGTDYECIEISPSSILALEPLIEEAINKIMMSQYYQQVSQQWQKTFAFTCGNKSIAIKGFLEFCSQFECFKTHPPIRGSTALSYDFYVTNGAYARNSYFLFGTPSQFRGI